MNSVIAVTVWSESEGEPLWTFFTGRTLPSFVTYGITPAGGRQTIPDFGEPRSPRPGEKLILDITYQFDNVLPPAACSGRKLFLVQVEMDEALTMIGEIASSPILDYDRLQGEKNGKNGKGTQLID